MFAKIPVLRPSESNYQGKRGGILDQAGVDAKAILKKKLVFPKCEHGLLTIVLGVLRKFRCRLEV